MKLEGATINKIDEHSTQSAIDKFNTALSNFIQIGQRLRVNELTAFVVFVNDWSLEITMLALNLFLAENNQTNNEQR